MKVRTDRQMDMLHGPMFKNILLFALPLAASGIIQQLFTSADMAVIFYFEGTTAQAAVNSNGALVNLIINLFSGMAVGSTVVIAEYIGKSLTDDIHSAVFTSLVVAAIGGLILLVIGICVAPPILELMGTPPEVLPLAVKYLRIYFIGMPFLMVYDFGAAILRSVGDTGRAFIVLFASGVLNIALNLLLVGAFDMGVAGVAIATVFANLVCAVLVVVFIMRYDVFGFKRGKTKFRREYLKRLIVIGLPAGLQGAVFSIANVFIQSSVNSFGDAAMAGSGDALNFEMFIYCFTTGFANAAVSFIGQNFAAGNVERCKRAMRLNMCASLAVATFLSLVFSLGGRVFIRIFTTDPAAIEYALIRMRCILTVSMLPCLYEVAGGALRGLGHSFIPALLTVIGSCVLRLVWIYTAFAAYHEFWLLMIIYPISWVATGGAMLVAYFVISRREFKNISSSVRPAFDGVVAEAAAVSDGRRPIGGFLRTGKKDKRDDNGRARRYGYSKRKKKR